MLLVLSMLKLLGAISFFICFEGFSVLLREAVKYFLGYLLEQGEISGWSEALLCPRVVIGKFCFRNGTPLSLCLSTLSSEEYNLRSFAFSYDTSMLRGLVDGSNS